MITPDLGTFLQLAERGNVIPVWKPVLADMLTPVSAYLRLARRARYAFLLESVEGGEQVARYTFLGADPHLILRARGEQVEIWERGRTSRRRGKVLDILREITARYRPVSIPGLPPFSAGAVGYFSYDLVGQFERVPPPRRSGSLGLPDALLMFFSNLLVFDHVKHQILIISNVFRETEKASVEAGYRAAEREIARMEKLLARPAPATSRLAPALGHLASHPGPGLAPFAATAPVPGSRAHGGPLRLRFNFRREAFEEAVRAAQRYIQAGDIFQVVLSLRLEARLSPDSFSIYRALRTVNPSPYMFFLKMAGDVVLGSSPEMLVKVSGREVEYRPIAGTRRRGKDEAEDQALESELLNDEKERAEHIMLVDLGRNDVGRVSEYGSVRVPGLMFVERYSHVMHLVSSIRGRLREGLDMFDALAACFPAGTVSGAPKVRAMEIIHELEPSRRGIYAGAVLYLDYSGNLNSCIAIRTLVVRRNTAYLQVGAGIVADSSPEREYEECINKSQALVKAMEMAQVGL